MAVTGGVAVWWWDSIFPDRRDFANLVHLPISTFSIFLANSAAVLMLTCVCAIDVNAASSILFPVSVSASQASFSFMMQFAGVHALVWWCSPASSASSRFSLPPGLLMLLPFTLFRRISFYVRTLIATSLLATLSTSFAVPRMILDLPRSSHSPLRFLPSAWLLGLCQLLRGEGRPGSGRTRTRSHLRSFLSICRGSCCLHSRLSPVFRSSSPARRSSSGSPWNAHVLDSLLPA